MKTIKARSAEASTRSSTNPVDEYIAAVPDARVRAALQKLREAIRAAAPQAEELISYQIPAYRQRGMLVSFAAFKDHCSFFVMSPEVMDAHLAELAGYKTSKGTIRFGPEQPLPAALVRKLVKARLRENESRARG